VAGAAPDFHRLPCWQARGARRHLAPTARKRQAGKGLLPRVVVAPAGAVKGPPRAVVSVALSVEMDDPGRELSVGFGAPVDLHT